MKSICILLSTYNGEKFLDEQLQSLRSQKGIDSYLLIRDDGSSDSTVSIINKWQQRYPGWILFIKGENVGFVSSFTELIKIALREFPTVQYFSFCDQDDVWLDDKLSVAISHLSNQKEEVPTLYFSNLTVVDADLNTICSFWEKNEVQITKQGALIQNFAPGCTEVFNRSAAEAYVTHYPDYVPFHDYLMYQICVFLGKVIYDESSHLLYRQHGNNQVGKKTRFQRYVSFLKKLISNGASSQKICLRYNQSFMKAYKAELSVEDLLIFYKLLNYKNNIFYRLSLFFDNEIKFTNLESNLLLKVKVLFGLL